MVSWRAGLVLLALLAGLVAVLVATRPGGPPPAAPGFLPCPSQNLVLLRIEGGGRAVELQRTAPGDQWRVTQPVQAASDPDGTSYLVSSLGAVKVLNTIAEPAAAATYGLDRPRELLTCRVMDGRSYNLSIGNQSFDGSGYYAQKTGDSRVFVISSVEVDAFDRALAEPPVKPSPSPLP